MNEVDARERPGAIQENQLFTAKELAKRLKMSTKTIRRLERSGAIPARRYGRLVRFVLADVVAAGK